jgi:hypothetical protein
MATRKVARVDKRSDKEIAIQGANNSNYSLLIPCVDQNFVYVTNPLTNETKHFQTNKPEFAAYIKELSELGLNDKLEKDFLDLGANNNMGWLKVLDFLRVNNALEFIA